MKLYELSNEWLALQDTLEESEGELNLDLEERLNRFQDELPQKLDNICCLLAQLQREEEAYKAEADRLYQKAQTARRSHEGLKDYAKLQLEKMGLDKIKTGRFALRITANSRPRISWDGPQAPPKKFQRVKIELDGGKAYEFFKAMGQLPPGFTIHQGTHLRIT